MILAQQKIELWAENWLPFALGAASCLAVYMSGHKFFSLAVQSGWHADVIYSSVFDVATVLTAFLFAFYTFVLTQETGFVARIKKARTYSGFLRFTTSSLYLGTSLIVCSIPIMVVEPKPILQSDPALVFVALWAGLSVWSFAAFARAALVFSVFVGQHR